MANTLNSINLLPNKGEGFLSQFLDWALTIGRLLVILTETVALGTFIYRFSIDMKIIDLHDQIKQESLIVKNLKDSEDIYRNLQDRLALAKKYDSAGSTTPTTLRNIIEMGRGRITFRSILVSSGAVRIEAQAASSISLSQFIQALKNYPEVTGLSIDHVDNKPSSALINVGITAGIKTKALEEQSAQQVPKQPNEQ